MKILFISSLLLVMLVAVNSCLAQVVEIQGFVFTTDGQPIKDVFVDGFGRTDDKGHFRIASDTLVKYRKTLVFDKRGFVPKVVQLEKSNTNFNVILESEKDLSIWNIPDCSITKNKQNRFAGRYLLLNFPKSLKFKSGIDTDYFYYSIGVKENGKQEWLHGGLGNMYGGTYPSGERLLELQSYTYSRTSVGIDWHGVTKDGKYWRYFGTPAVFETYDYETESREAANLFDKILDGVCFQPQK